MRVDDVADIRAEPRIQGTQADRAATTDTGGESQNPFGNGSPFGGGGGGN